MTNHFQAAKLLARAMLMVALFAVAEHYAMQVGTSRIGRRLTLIHNQTPGNGSGRRLQAFRDLPRDSDAWFRHRRRLARAARHRRLAACKKCPDGGPYCVK